MIDLTRAAFVAVVLSGTSLVAAGCEKQVALAPDVACDFTPMLTAMKQPGLAMVPSVPGTMTPIPLNSVSMTDGAITNKVLVQSTAARRTPTQTVEVFARMTNCTDFPLQVEGRTHFFDDKQAPEEPVSAWQRVFLPARSIGTYQDISTGTGAVATYLIELREGR
jgi:hypothetical protein